MAIVKHNMDVFKGLVEEGEASMWSLWLQWFKEHFAVKE